jgi:hypothetical protein
VRFAFRDMPDGRGAIWPRPIVDVVVDGLDIAPQACLLDGGATAVRFGMHVAELCGIDLAGAPTQRVAAGGALVMGHAAEVTLLVTDESDSYAWTTVAWFCEPWTPAFGLLGLTGFFDQFEVTFAAYDERIDLRRVNR